MLEIIVLIVLCMTNRKNAVAVGKSGGGAIGLTIGLWLGLEFLGAFIGGAAELGVGSYILALVFAAIGAITSYFIAKKPSKKLGVQATPVYVPGSTYNTTQSPMPQPQGYAAPYPQAGVSAPNRFCLRCGQQLMEGTQFCGACGAAVNGSAQPMPARQTAVPAAPATPPSMQMPPVSPRGVMDSASPVPPPNVYKQKDVFYVFAAQGPDFGMAVGDDIILEKAQKLKDDYDSVADMDIKTIRPDQWEANIQSLNIGEVMSVSYNFDIFKDGVRAYLLKEGIPGGTIERGIRLCEENSIQLSNPMIGMFVMGIPLVHESKPDAEVEGQPPLTPEPAPQPAAVSCAHEYKHFTCVKCGEKAPKPQLASEGIRKQNAYTYEDYTAQTAEEARYFLERTTIEQPLYYVMVHTPEGDWGKDKDGMFLSQLCDFQRDLSLRQGDAKTAFFPERMPDLQMAANKVTDNYLLSVTCGLCGYSWVDGVGYRTKTIVRCPECGQYNLADTTHIHFNDL